MRARRAPGALEPERRSRRQPPEARDQPPEHALRDEMSFIHSHFPQLWKRLLLAREDEAKVRGTSMARSIAPSRSPLAMLTGVLTNFFARSRVRGAPVILGPVVV